MPTIYPSPPDTGGVGFALQVDPAGELAWDRLDALSASLYGAVGDGSTDDAPAIQAAIDALSGSQGGIVALPPRIHRLGSGLTITANRRIVLDMSGATLLPDAGVTPLTIHQGSTGGSKRGAYAVGGRIAGQNRAGVIGVNFTDTNWAGLFGVQIEDCPTGILMHCEGTNEFVEGITLQDVVIRNPTVYGIEARRTGGTNSLGQHSWRNVNVNVGGSGIGLLIPAGVSFYRSRLELGVWLGSNQTAVSIDGDMDNTVLDLFVEGATGSVGNTAIAIGSNATNLDKMLLHYSPWGTIATSILNASNKLMMYQQGRRFIGAGGAAPIQVWAHGSTGPSVTLEHGGPAGGRVTLGSQAGGVQDVNLYRAAADVLATDDALEMVEQAADPAAPTANRARLFLRDVAGKTQLAARFPTGAVVPIATEP